MALERLSMARITDLIRMNLGETTPSQSKIANTDPAAGDLTGMLTGIYHVINNYLQMIPSRLVSVMRAIGSMPKDGVVRLSMWRTPAVALTASSGSSSVYFPVDYYRWISFYDTTYKRTILPVERTGRWFISRLTTKSGGAPERIVIQGFTTNAGAWVRQGTLLPTVPSGFTPTINLEYYRLPAAVLVTADMTASYPDIDLAFQDLCIAGPTVELMRSDDPSYSRWVDYEKEMLVALAQTARAE